MGILKNKYIVIVLIICILYITTYGLYTFRGPLRNTKEGSWTASRLAYISDINDINSVDNLADWIAGTASEIDITNDGDGTITIGIIDPLAVAKGGTGQSSYTNGQLLIGNTTGNTLAKATLTGTANQIIVTNGAGSITLSLPQDINVISTPRFSKLYIDDTNTYLDSSDSNMTFTDAVTGTKTLAELAAGGAGAETDPCWTVWLAGPPNISIFTNDSGYITSYSEIDPCLALLDINSTDVTNWGTAYNWGDHSLAGYLTSYSETDPCYTLWIGGPPNISEFTNDSGYLTSYSEIDPCMAAHLGNYDHNDIADGATAYSWGDHSLAGYLTSYSETDPCFSLLDINSTDVTNWGIAYGWGDHSVEGYLTAEVDGDVTNEIQDIFYTIRVLGQNDVNADSSADVLTLIEGTNITLTTDDVNDTITITASGGGGAPGGNNTEIQYNENGAFGGDDGLTYDDDTNTVTIDFVTINRGASFDAEYDNGNSGTDKTIDWDNGNKQKITLTADCNFTFTDPCGACNIILKVVQDGTGGWDVNWPALGSSAPSISATASTSTITCFYYDGTNYYGTSLIATGTGQSRDYLLYRDVKAAGVDGGSFASGAWRTRTLTEETIDTGNNGTFSDANDSFTLIAGTYECMIIAPCFDVGDNQIRLYNITDASIMVYGTNAQSDKQGQSVIWYRWEITSAKEYRIEHRGTESQNTNGFGRANNFGGDEVYCTVQLYKVN